MQKRYRYLVGRMTKVFHLEKFKVHKVPLQGIFVYKYAMGIVEPTLIHRHAHRLSIAENFLLPRSCCILLKESSWGALSNSTTGMFDTTASRTSSRNNKQKIRYISAIFSQFWLSDYLKNHLSFNFLVRMNAVIIYIKNYDIITKQFTNRKNKKKFTYNQFCDP
jgi:hypothetical protein